MFAPLFLQRSVGERNHGTIFNEQSLPSYKMDSSASQIRACSDILSRPFLSREVSDVNTGCSSSMAGGKVHVSFVASSQTHSVQPTKLNCTINFNTFKQALSNFPFMSFINFENSNCRFCNF